MALSEGGIIALGEVNVEQGTDQSKPRDLTTDEV